MKGIATEKKSLNSQRGEYSELEKKLRKKLALIVSQLGGGDKRKEKRNRKDKRHNGQGDKRFKTPEAQTKTTTIEPP